MARVPFVRVLHRFWLSGWGFDWLYDRLFVQPFVWMAHINRDDVIDRATHGAARLSRFSNRVLSRTQSGLVRRYVAVIAAGSIVIVAIMLLS
jgi:NADH-quinone oxidoreductase subunit L